MWEKFKETGNIEYYIKYKKEETKENKQKKK